MDPINLDEARKQRLADQITEVSKDLAQLEATEVAKLPENIFAGVFLPFFAGEENKYNASIDLWLSVSKGPCKPVDIIDGNGKTLFRVPPVMNRDAVKPSDPGMPNIYHVAQTAEQYARIHPRQGDQYLSQEFTRRALIMRTAPNVLENVEAWNNIFKRYNREPIVPLENTPVASSGPATSEEQIDEFDPL